MAGARYRFCDTPEELAQALGEVVPRPTAVVGVGMPLCGDDGFGPAVAAALQPTDVLRPFDVQGVPESFLGPIVGSDCPGVLFVDTADLGAAPGRLALVGPEHLAEVNVSTHVVSLGLMAEAVKSLARETTEGREVRCVLLAAQPQNLKRIDHLSPPVREAVRRAVAGIEAFAKGAPAR